MLMHEWRQYRERQIHKVAKEARETENLTVEAAADEAGALVAEGRGAAAPEALKSEPGQPKKQLLERLTSTNSVMAEKMQAYAARQQVLPLDVEAAPPHRRPARRQSRASNLFSGCWTQYSHWKKRRSCSTSARRPSGATQIGVCSSVTARQVTSAVSVSRRS